jgi:hypothetical protein
MSRMDEESMVATLPWLRQRLLDELGLQEVRVGRHVPRDHRGRAGALDLVGIWVAEVRPAFVPPPFAQSLKDRNCVGSGSSSRPAEPRPRTSKGPRSQQEMCPLNGRTRSWMHSRTRGFITRVMS